MLIISIQKILSILKAIVIYMTVPFNYYEILGVKNEKKNLACCLVVYFVKALFSESSGTTYPLKKILISKPSIRQETPFLG